MRRLVLAALVLLLTAGGGELEPVIPNCDQFQDDAEYEACVAYVGELLMAQQMAQQMQEQIALPPDFATPNQPTTIILDQGGSSVGEWAALLTGVAALLAALEAVRRRRRGHVP